MDSVSGQSNLITSSGLTEDQLLDLESGKELKNVDTEFADALAQTVHLANDSDQEIKIIIGLSLEWKIIDFLVDVAQLVSAYGSLVKALKGIVSLPSEIKTVKQLYDTVKLCIEIVMKIKKVGDKGEKAADDFLKIWSGKHTVKIKRAEYKPVWTSDWKSYFNASGYAALMKAKTLEVIVSNGFETRFVKYKTHNDRSWITMQDGVRSAEHGKIWKPDPKGTFHRWEISK